MPTILNSSPEIDLHEIRQTNNEKKKKNKTFYDPYVPCPSRDYEKNQLKVHLKSGIISSLQNLVQPFIVGGVHNHKQMDSLLFQCQLCNFCLKSLSSLSKGMWKSSNTAPPNVISDFSTA